jgi:hypothetical protein
MDCSNFGNQSNNDYKDLIKDLIEQMSSCSDSVNEPENTHLPFPSFTGVIPGFRRRLLKWSIFPFLRYL